jgi:hypothetical protein
MAESANKPGKGFLGWLGRQVGYVKQAAKTDVTAPPPAQPQTLYREARVEEKDHPQDPNVKLRRTVIDEVIVNEGAQNTDRRSQNEDKSG